MRIKSWLINLAWSLVGILAKLEVPPKTGHAPAYWMPDTPEQSRISAAVHYLVLSGTRFREFIRYFRSGVILWVYSLGTVSISAYLHCRYQFSQAHKWRWRIWGIGRNDRCPYFTENTKKHRRQAAKAVPKTA
ncbi:MAG TPA: hypothetical protein VGY56_13765 [Verrucomicrobiae bacterium]|nr:hypothetical protein [Verrucomicrobiae bacterium]